MNRAVAGRLTKLLCSKVQPLATIAILGLAYKPYSHVVEESQGIYLARELAALGFRVVAYDPLANAMARQELTDKVVVLEDVQSCLQQADAVVITTPDPTFRALEICSFPEKNPRLVVLDCWRILRRKLESTSHVRYIPLGIGIHDESNGARLSKMWSDEI
jgi:UDPglucose 6-dehydrogenase